MALLRRLSLSIITYSVHIRATRAVTDDCRLEEDNTSSLVTALVFTYLICIASALFILFHLIRFYDAEKRGEPVIENRHPNLVYALNALVILMNIFLFPLAIDFWTLECVTGTSLVRHPEPDNESDEIIENLLFC